MQVYISLLRGINVGSARQIDMKSLSVLYESLGFTNVVTYIRSGNVIFESADKDLLEMKQIIEEGIIKAFGFAVSVIIRTIQDFQNIIENNPFQKEDLKKVHAAFLSDVPKNPSFKDFDSVKDSSEKYFMSPGGKEIYLYYPNGVAKTKMSNLFLEKKLNVIATTRNWSTVLKLLEMAKLSKK
jgi:uncharacterized protein (DUF1697 family)